LKKINLDFFATVGGPLLINNRRKLVFATVFAQNAIKIDSNTEMKQEEVRETTAESEETVEVLERCAKKQKV
jgi:hypothetical protein